MMDELPSSSDGAFVCVAAKVTLVPSLHVPVFSINSTGQDLSGQGPAPSAQLITPVVGPPVGVPCFPTGTVVGVEVGD